MILCCMQLCHLLSLCAGRTMVFIRYGIWLHSAQCCKLVMHSSIADSKDGHVLHADQLAVRGTAVHSLQASGLRGQ